MVLLPAVVAVVEDVADAVAAAGGPRVLVGPINPEDPAGEKLLAPDRFDDRGVHPVGNLMRWLDRDRVESRVP